MASKTNTADLTISDLADVLAALTEVTKSYELGIQLKIDLAELDSIEKNHPQDIDRQKTEVIKYWLRNSPDASWTTLANAVKRMGGYARLVGRLKSKEVKSGEEKQNTSAIKVEGMRRRARSVDAVERVLSKKKKKKRKTSVYCARLRVCSLQHSLDTCAERNILLLGKMGHGTSTLGNRMLGSDGWFKINDQRCPQTTQGSSMLSSASQLKDYQIEVYDHSGLFEGASSVDKLASALPEMLNLVIFVLKCGCDFDESEVEILKSVVSEWQISGISALILTHYQRRREEK